MNKKKIGIIMATYNGEKYLREQLDSIIDQTYNDWFLFVSDDNSTDGTNKILLEYKKKYKEKIFIYSNNTDSHGAKDNFANCFALANGCDYYMLCDQDDVWEQNKIEVMVDFIERYDNSTPILVYSDCYLADHNLNIINESFTKYLNKYLPKKNIKKHVLLENYFPGCSVLFNSELKQKISVIPKEAEMHDWWITIVAALFGNIYFLDKPLHYYRQHSNNTIGANNKENNSFLIRIKKVLNYKKNIHTWRLYQKIIIDQCNAIAELYANEDISEAKSLIHIMKYPKFFRLFCLIKNKFIPHDKIRIFRLVF